MAEDPNVNLLNHVMVINPQGVRDALANGANPNVIQHNGNTPLLMISGPVLTRRYPDYELYGGVDGRDIFMDSMAIATALLDAGADINYQNPNGYTALMYAAQNDHINMIAMLMSRGADERIRNNQGISSWDFCRSSACRGIIMNKQKREFKQQATNSIPMLAAQYARSTPQTKREWLKILLLQKHAEFCEDQDPYRYLGALWGLAEILGVGYDDLMFDKSDLCVRIRERLKEDV